MVGCGIPVGLSIFESFFVLSPAVLLILGAFAFAAVAHFLMTNTWCKDCKSSFCYGNKSLSVCFGVGKISISFFTPIGGAVTIALGLLQALNLAVALVLGTVSAAIFIYFWFFMDQGKNDTNKENSNDARKDDSELSERKWLKFMTVMYPIACVLLLLSALAGTLPFTTALISCIPFGVIGLFTGICFWRSKYHKPNGELLINENRDIDNIGQNNLDKLVEQATPGEIYNNALSVPIPQNQFNGMNLQHYPNDNNDNDDNILPTREELEAEIAKKRKQKDTLNGNELKNEGNGDVNLSPQQFYNINEIDY